MTKGKRVPEAQNNHAAEIAELRGAVTTIAESTKQHGAMLSTLVATQGRLEESVRSMSDVIRTGLKSQGDRLTELDDRVNRDAIQGSRTNWSVVFSGMAVLVVIGGLFVEGRTGPIAVSLNALQQASANSDARQQGQIDRALELSVRTDQTVRMMSEGWLKPGVAAATSAAR